MLFINIYNYAQASTSLTINNQEIDALIKVDSQNNNKIDTATAQAKITKSQPGCPRFVDTKSYADLQTIPMNRPEFKEKQEFFTPAEYKKESHYLAPNMDAWASQRPGQTEYKIGTINTSGRPITLNGFYEDPIKKYPGPK